MDFPLRRRFCGFLYCFLWFSSILSGFFILICPFVIVAFISPNLYRRWTDLVFGMWEPYPVALMEVLFNTRIIMNGDWIDPSEGGLVIMNHRTRLDWNFLWAAYYHGAHPHNHCLKYILKAPIMHIPGPGWVMQACSFLFINRHWETDRQLISNSLEYLQITEKHCQVLLFPEGTDLTPKSLAKSDAFAEKNKLEKYIHVLHPRTTGFVHVANTMRRFGQLQAVYDLTVGYPKNIAETELDLLKGNFPSEIHFLVERFDSSEIPNEEELKDWLNNRWKEKEMLLRQFYEHGTFNPRGCSSEPDEDLHLQELRRRRRSRKDFFDVCECQNYYAHDVYTVHMPAPEYRAQTAQDSDSIQNGPDHSFEEDLDKVSEKRCRKMRCYGTGSLLYSSLISWTVLVIVFYYLTTKSYFQMWIFFNSLVFAALSYVSDGFHQVLARYNNNECLLRRKTD